jgi:hypothetical protein
MVPFPIGLPEGTLLGRRLSHLERTLSLSFAVLQGLLERLEAKFGPDFLGEELHTFTTVGRTQAQELANQIDALVREGKQPVAVRVFHDVSGVSWDEAHGFIGTWECYAFDEKVHLLQLGLWAKALGTVPRPSNDGVSSAPPAISE